MLFSIQTWEWQLADGVRMTQRLRYGRCFDTRIWKSLQTRSSRIARERADTVVADPATAVAEALSNPLGYPPLTQASVPGDRVVIAIDSDVPLLAAHHRRSRAHAAAART